jgi:hypothetical protein
LQVCLLVAASSGCAFYSDDDDDCKFGGGATEAGAAVYDPGQIDPQTGVCQYFGGGGGGGCGDPCTPCNGDSDRAPTPTWGYCESQCTGLDEATCKLTSGCRAIYGGDTYAACWATDQTGPIEGGGCDGLDATACSLHDDCAAVHEGVGCAVGGGGDGSAQDTPTLACGVGNFQSCRDENASTGYGTCDGELTCQMDPPQCPADATPGIADGCYTGYCIPLANCDEPDPGLCYAGITCESASPACPDGTTPGIKDGCYTGWCIPLADCEAAPACSEITVEATCIARDDCTPTVEALHHLLPALQAAGYELVTVSELEARTR